MIKSGQVLQKRYLVEKQIGAGGMGAVHLGVDQRFGSVVAIKETFSTDPRLSQAFEREALLLNSLRHSALPHVIDYFVEDGGQFIVMEYIAGKDLSVIIEEDTIFTITDILRWADDLLDALNYLHSQKLPIIHRDIKPQNLKLTPSGEIILLDFGLAKGNPTELSQLTMTKSIFGYSRCYAPLEQIQGTGTDPRSDLYSLAATLYHLLTNQPPTDALTRATTVLSNNPDPLLAAQTLNPQIPTEISQILHQAMALNANIRPESATEMRVALKKTIPLSVNPTNLIDSIENPEAVEPLPVLRKAVKAFQASNKKHFKTAAKTAPEKSSPSTNHSVDELRVKTKQPDLLAIRSFLPDPKKAFRSVMAARIAVAALLLSGLIFAILSSQSPSIQATDSNVFQPEAVIDPAIKVDKEDSSQKSSAATVISPQTASPSELPESNLTYNEKKISAADSPLTDLNETAKTNGNRKKIVSPKQLPTREKINNNRALNDDYPKETQESDNDKEAKIVRAGDNRSGGGLRGMLKKIGSGALNFPKNIFKKKKY